MAAPQGNEFWKLRSKHGRDKLFETPQMLWDAACEYFEWCNDHPFHEHDIKVVDKIIQEVKIPRMRPYTLHGLCGYCDCTTSYFRQFKSALRNDKEDFVTVIEKIEEVIYNQKFSGAAAGFLKENIIARDLGLWDKTVGDLNVTGIRIIRDEKA